MAEHSNKLEDMIRTSLQSIGGMLDANTVVGTPIETASGTTIIPISKISVGYASGGFDRDGKVPPKNFAGGGGTGLSVQPVCFLTVNAEGEVSVLPVTPTSPTETVEKVMSWIDSAPDIVEKLKALFGKFKKKKAETAEEAAETVEEVVRTATEATETVVETEVTTEEA